MSFNEYIDRQISERYTGKKAVRKDAVRMVKVLFTSDSDFFEHLTAEQQREYFQSCYDWAAERWGSNNIISAAVHLDEKTPHLHLNFVPLTVDGRLSAKECIGNGSIALQKLQDDFFQTVGKRFGLERGSKANLENGERPRRHQRVAEYKANTKYYQQQKNALEGDVQALQGKINKFNDILHSESLNAVEGVPVPSVAKLAIGKENKDKLLYSPSDIEHLQELAKACAVTAAANDRRSSELDQQAERQEHISAELSEREHLITIKEQKAEYARSSAESKLKEAEEKQAFYATSEPMVKRLQQRINDLMTDKKEIIQDYRKEIAESKKLSDTNKDLAKRSLKQQEQIRELHQSNADMSERIRILEDDIRKKEAQAQQLQSDLDKLKKEQELCEKLYCTAYECGEYVCDKFGLDFDKIFDMKLKNGVSYDEDRGMSR